MENQIHASPGVYFRIIDYSSYSVLLTSTSLALAETAKKGPTTPVQIQTINQFTSVFGTPRTTDFSCFAALSYLEYSSNLWFCRIVGDNAKKATVDIPSARYIENERLTTTQSFNRYIYSGRLNELPIANTVQLYLHNPDNSSSGVLITANRDGEFYNEDSSSILDNPNYIDYDTGEYYFTLVNLTPNTEVYATYNDSDRTVENDVIYSVTDRAGNTTFDNIITKYGNIVASSFQATVASGNERYLFTVVSGNENTLQCTSNASLTGTFDAKTGKCSFNLTTVASSLYDDITITATYNFLRSYRKRLDTYVSTDEVNGQGYIGSIGTSIIPSTFKIYANDEIIAQDDNDSGNIIGVLTNETLPITQFQTNASISATKPFEPGTLNIYLDEVLVLSDTLENGELTAINDSKLSGTINYRTKEITFGYTDGSTTFDETSVNIEYTTNYIIDCDNTVNEDDGTIEFALVKPLPDNYVVDVSYMAKEIYNIKVQTIDTTVTGSLIKLPVAHGSVSVIKNGVVVLVDEYDTDENTENTGYLIAQNNSGMNGTINYETGEFEIYSVRQFDVEELEFAYLAKIGTANALYYGESYDGISLRFYNDIDNGLCLSIWDNTQSTSEIPIETWEDLVLDDINSNRYIVNKVNSNYVEFDIDSRTDNLTTPLMQTVLTLSGGDSDESTISVENAITSLQQYEDVDTYDINLIACSDFPGDKTLINYLLNMCQNVRGDCFTIVDPPRNLTVQQVVDWHNGGGTYTEQNSLNSSFGALYYPWVQVSDTYSESYVWVPPSVKVLSAYAYNDNVSYSWYAPAGLNRGQLYNVIKVERRLTIGDRDLLYATSTNCVNPICDFAGDGIVIYGQKTLQRKTSALNRVNVMRMLIYVTKTLATSVKYLLFEPNDPITWAQFRNLVSPVVEYVRQNRGLDEYQVLCDETTNTSSMIDDNTMCAQVWLKPVKAAEKIVADYVITSAGADLTNVSVTSETYSS